MKLILFTPLFLLVLFGALGALILLMRQEEKEKPAEEKEKNKSDMTAFVFCAGGSAAKEKYRYEGIFDCRMAVPLSGGNKLCENACAGLGNCVRACPVGAIKIREHLAFVQRDACIGCGACQRACPKHLIAMIPKKAAFAIPCRCGDKGAKVLRFCDTGCIGCKKCEKVCPEGAIDTSEGYARILQESCSACGACAEVCPRAILRPIR